MIGWLKKKHTKRRVIAELNQGPRPHIPACLNNWTGAEYEFDKLMQQYLNRTRRKTVWEVPTCPANPDFSHYVRHGSLPFNIHEELYEEWER